MQEETYLSLRLIKNAVHCVQHGHLLIKVQNCLFGELRRRETHNRQINIGSTDCRGLRGIFGNQEHREADCTWGSWEGLMIFPCLSITRYTGIPEMTLGWMNSSWSTNSAEAPGNWGFSSEESKGCCSWTTWKDWIQALFINNLIVAVAKKGSRKSKHSISRHTATG